MTRWELLHADCRAVMANMGDATVDSVVCDPPYHLTSIVKRFGAAGASPAGFGTDGAYARASRGFMGQTWDGGDVAFDPSLWAEVLRVLKPGGHLLAFSGSRTYHRMAVAIEDAGFEIRDQIMWLYGSGFPKSHDISKAIDKAAGARGHDSVGFNAAGLGAGLASNGGSKFRSDHPDYVKPSGITDAARQWEGWGTALKPAHEPIVLARKPLDGTVAGNVLAHGVGGLNIDGCRVEAGDGANRARPPRTENAIYGGGSGTNLTASQHNSAGRFPANVIHDGSDEVVAGFPAQAGAQGQVMRQNAHTSNSRGAFLGKEGPQPFYSDSGSAARFFYCAKASKADRGGDNIHPTVKPTDLMRYLVRLVTPPGGLVFDPFTGSGSTGKAAMLEGFRFLGAEMTEEYVPIARARIAAACGD